MDPRRAGWAPEGLVGPGRARWAPGELSGPQESLVDPQESSVDSRLSAMFEAWGVFWDERRAIFVLRDRPRLMWGLEHIYVLVLSCFAPHGSAWLPLLLGPMGNGRIRDKLGISISP